MFSHIRRVKKQSAEKVSSEPDVGRCVHLFNLSTTLRTFEMWVTPWLKATHSSTAQLHPSHLGSALLDSALWRGQNSNFKGQLYKQDTGVFIFLSKHRRNQQGSSGWFMRWERFFEPYVRWGLLSWVERNIRRLSFLKSSHSGFPQVFTAAGYSNRSPLLPFSLSHSHTKSTHQRRPFFFYLFPRRALPCTFQTWYKTSNRTWFHVQKQFVGV